MGDNYLVYYKDRYGVCNAPIHESFYYGIELANFIEEMTDDYIIINIVNLDYMGSMTRIADYELSEIVKNL